MLLVIEMEKISNDENIKNLKKRKVLRYIIMILAFATIIFGIVDLFVQKTIFLIITIGLFLLTTLLQNYREKLRIVKHEELDDVREEIKTIKEKYRVTNESIKEEKKEEPVKEEIKEELKPVPKKKTTSNTKKSTGTKKKTTSSTKKKTGTSKKTGTKEKTTTKKKSTK